MRVRNLVMVVAVGALAATGAMASDDPAAGHYKQSGVPRACLDSAPTPSSVQVGGVTWQCQLFKSGEEIYNSWEHRPVRGKDIFTAQKLGGAVAVAGYHVKQDDPVAIEPPPQARKLVAVVSNDRRESQPPPPPVVGWQYSH